MHFNHSCFCCNEKALTEENFQGGIIHNWYTQMSKINPVNTPVHVHAAIHYVRDLFQKSTNFKTCLTCKDSISQYCRQQNRKLQRL